MWRTDYCPNGFTLRKLTANERTAICDEAFSTLTDGGFELSELASMLMAAWEKIGMEFYLQASLEIISSDPDAWRNILGFEPTDQPIPAGELDGEVL